MRAFLLPKNTKSSNRNQSWLVILRSSPLVPPKNGRKKAAPHSLDKYGLPSGYTEEQCAFIQRQHKEVAFVFEQNLGNRKGFSGMGLVFLFGKQPFFFSK